MFSFLLGVAIGWYIDSAKDRIAAFYESVRTWL